MVVVGVVEAVEKRLQVGEMLDDRLAARRGARDLRTSILAAGAGLLLFTAATAVVWFGP
ncbi:hypothetical protein ACI2LC_39470 [Nonomuraea wenchangensis]|uniref:hypothetical protein n=1 Tax=Nonomuraea wenchangensis TaxID=568860 RepID=UPI0034098DB9